MGKEGPQDKTRDGFNMRKAGPNLGKEGPKDRLEMVSREPTCAKKVPKDRLEMGFEESKLEQRRSQG